jgi:hypothetical protein
MNFTTLWFGAWQPMFIAMDERLKQKHTPSAPLKEKEAAIFRRSIKQPPRLVQLKRIESIERCTFLETTRKIVFSP